MFVIFWNPENMNLFQGFKSCFDSSSIYKIILFSEQADQAESRSTMKLYYLMAYYASNMEEERQKNLLHP